MTQINRRTPLPTVLLGFLVLFSTGLSATAEEPNERGRQSAYGNHSINGLFAFSMDGSFSSASPQSSGAIENFAFSQVGLYRFDGHGKVTGEFSLAFENETSGGKFSTAIEIGTYDVTEDGRMSIWFQDYRGDVLINDVALDCVIVQRRRLARCAMVGLISYQQGPQPVVLPVTGLGTFQRQR